MAPEIVFDVPFNRTVLVDGVNVPAFEILPSTVNVEVLASHVAPLLIVHVPLMVVLPPNDFAFDPPFKRVKFPCETGEIVCAIVPLYTTVLVLFSVFTEKFEGKLFDPPTFITADAAILNVPPRTLLLAVNVVRSNVPAVRVRFPLIVMFADGDAVPDPLLMVR